MFQHLKSNQKHEYPCYMFFKGITNFTLLTAAESVGIAFLLSMFTIPLSGQLFWNTVKEQLQPNGETVSTTRCIWQKYVIPEKSKLFEVEEEVSGIICDVMNIHVLKMILAFYAWYEWGEPFPVNDMVSISAVKKSITILLTSIKEFIPRNHGNGWKLSFMNFYIYLWIFICLIVHKIMITHQQNMDWLRLQSILQIILKKVNHCLCPKWQKDYRKQHC